MNKKQNIETLTDVSKYLDSFICMLEIQHLLHPTVLIERIRDFKRVIIHATSFPSLFFRKLVLLSSNKIEFTEGLNCDRLKSSEF